MAFSPWDIVGCSLKKRFTKGGGEGGGHGHPSSINVNSKGMLLALIFIFGPYILKF